MTGLEPRCYNVSMASILQHPCLFKARPCVQLRLRHYSRLAERRPSRHVRSAMGRDGDYESCRPHRDSTRSHSRASRQYYAEQNSFTPQTPLVHKILNALKQIGLAALVVLFGLSRAVVAHARYAAVLPYCLAGFAACSLIY